MPERDRLTAQQIRAILKSEDTGKWVVVRIADGAVLGRGNGSLQALRAAKSEHSKMDLDDVAVMFVAHLGRSSKNGVPSTRSER
jgi:hypothetical protein